tara:strand:+ start:19532 stop:20488 length:957 start_codon:yes stop_codon:yes gene_type:complete
MSRLVVPEFEEGDEITSNKFNQLNKALADLKIDGQNIANEAINQNLVKENTVFSNHFEDGFGSTTITGDRRGIYQLWRADNQNWISKNRITFSDISRTDKILVRASCRITLPDYGFKTFFEGTNPVIRMMLRYRFNVEDGVTGDDEGWQNVPSTHQEFSCAFGGKIPSDSSLSFVTCKTVGGTVTTGDFTADLSAFFHLNHSGRGLNEERSNTGVTTGTSGEHRDTTDPSTSSPARYDISYRDSQPFALSVDYTVAHLLDPLIAYDNVQFAVWGSHNDWFAGGGDTKAGGASPDGCLKPEFFGFFVSDFNLYGYKIQK